MKRLSRSLNTIILIFFASQVEAEKMEPIAEDVLPGLVFCTYMNAGRYILCESLPAYHEYIAQGNLKAAERLTFDPNSNEKPPLLRKKLRLLRKAYK